MVKWPDKYWQSLSAARTARAISRRIASGGCPTSSCRRIRDPCRIPPASARRSVKAKSDQEKFQWLLPGHRGSNTDLKNENECTDSCRQHCGPELDDEAPQRVLDRVDRSDLQVGRPDARTPPREVRVFLADTPESVLVLSSGQ